MTHMSCAPRLSLIPTQRRTSICTHQSTPANSVHTCVRIHTHTNFGNILWRNVFFWSSLWALDRCLVPTRPGEQLPGQVTDDSELAMALLEGLLEASEKEGNTFDLDPIARHYRDWVRLCDFLPERGNYFSHVVWNHCCNA